MEPTPVQVAVDKRSWDSEKNSEKKWMLRDRQVVVKVPSMQQLAKQSHGSYQCCLLSGSCKYAWGLHTRLHFSCGRVQSAYIIGWRTALSLAQLVKPHELLKETEQPPAGSLIINVWWLVSPSF